MRFKIALLSVAVIVWAAAWWYKPPVTPPCVFTAIDVGQGDAILIQTPDGQDMLIDGGPNDGVVQKLSRLLPPGDRELELVVMTHTDADHLNGLVSVLEKVPVKQIFSNGMIAKSLKFSRWRELITEKNVPERIVAAGENYTLGKFLHFTVLWPPPGMVKSVVQDEPNELSIGIKLTCAGSTAIMIGDAASEVEDRIVDSGTDITASLLKVGHHGSRFSSSAKFLSAVTPTWAIIPVGARNTYNHPHPTTLLRLEKAGAMVIRTDEIGNVRLESDGRGGWERPP